MRSTFLQVMGILFIISGAVALLINLVTMWLILLTGFSAILSAIRATLTVVAGIKAVTTYTDRYRAAACVVWGAIIIILTVVEFFVSLAYLSGFAVGIVFSFFLLPFSLVLPVTYFIAAFRFVRKK